MATEKNIEKYNQTLQKYVDNKAFVKLYRTVCGNEETLSGFILAVSNLFLLLRPADDFMLDGFAIIRTDDYDSIRHSSYERTQRKIYKAEGLLSENFAFEKPIPLTGWADIFRTLKRYDIHVIIESIDGNSIDFRIGPIKRVTEKSVTIHNYDPDGKLEEKPTNIRYDAISIVQFGDRYSTVFRKYLK